MLDPIFIRRKIALIQEDLDHLAPLYEMTFSDAAKDWTRWNALEWALAKIIGRAIDINRHILAELGEKNMQPPKDYTESFILLKELDIFPKVFVLEIAKSAGFRNRIIHEYNEIDKNLVYNTIGEAIEQYTQYCSYVLQFLESFSKENSGIKLMERKNVKSKNEI